MSESKDPPQDNLEAIIDSYKKDLAAELRQIEVDNGIDPLQEFNDFLDDNFSTEDIEKEKTPERLRVQTTEEFTVLQTQGWFIKGLLPRAELVMIYGAPGSGKTFATLDMVMAIARDLREWCGYKVKPGTVTYICAESPSGFRNRMVAYFNRHQVATKLPSFNIIADAPSLLSNDDIKLLCERIGKVDIVVIDTLSRTINGGDENNGKDMSLLIANCQKISRTTDSMVILVHHSGKDVEKGSRGWSGLLGAVDTEIKIEAVGFDRSLTVTKQKDGESNVKIAFNLAPLVIGIDEDDDDITSCVFEHSQVMPREMTKDAKLGGVQKIIMDAVKMIPERPIMMDDLLALSVANIPHDNSKKDERRKRFFNSLETLQSKGIISVSNNIIYIS